MGGVAVAVAVAPLHPNAPPKHAHKTRYRFDIASPRSFGLVATLDKNTSLLKHVELCFSTRVCSVRSAPRFTAVIARAKRTRSGGVERVRRRDRFRVFARDVSADPARLGPNSVAPLL